MTQTTFPEIQAAAEALEARIALTETEVDQRKESMKAKKALVRSWRKALAAIGTRPATPKKRTGTKSLTASAN